MKLNGEETVGYRLMLSLVLSAFFLTVASAQERIQVVTNTNDTGPGSLRQAILDSNLTPEGPGGINFDIPGPGPHKIAPLTPLPPMESGLIDGLSQPGAEPNSSKETNNATLKIEISGENGIPIGLHLSHEPCTIRGIVFNQFSDTCILGSANFGGITVDGCWFGLDALGNPAGGATGSGIRFTTTGFIVAVDNWYRRLRKHAIEVIDSEYVGLGSSRIDECVSALKITGSFDVYFDNSVVIESERPAVEIEANTTKVSMTSVVFSGGMSPAVNIRDSSEVQVVDSIIEQQGISVIGGSGHRFSRNTFRLPHEGVIGINLVGGVEDSLLRTANDLMDLDEGPNRLQNYPMIQSASATDAGTTIQGTLNSSPNTEFELEFYATEADHGECGMYIGTQIVTTDGQGNSSFTAIVPTVVKDVSKVSGLAIDPENNTSELSPSIPAEVSVTNYHDIVLSGRFLNDIVVADEPLDLELAVAAFARGNASTDTNLSTEIFIELPQEAILLQAPTNALVHSYGVVIPGLTVRPGQSNVVGLKIAFGEQPGFRRYDIVASALEPGPITTNNSVNVSAWVVDEDMLPPLLAVSMIQETNIAEATWSGWQHTYQIVVTNLNPFPLRDVVVTNFLPSTNLYGARLHSATGNPIHTNNTLIFNIPEIPGGGAETFDISVTPTAPTTLTNSARFGLANGDYAPSILHPEFAETNFVSVVTEARTSIPISNVELTVSPTNQVGISGSDVAFKVNVVNRGYRDEPFVALTNFFSRDIDFVSATSTFGDGMTNRFSAGREIVWPAFSLNTGEIANAIIVMRPSSAGFATLTSVAFGDTGLEILPGDNLAVQTVETLSTPEVELPSHLNFNSGLFEETVVFQNQTTGPLPGVRILVEDLQDGVVVYNASGHTNGIPYADHLDQIPPGASIRFRIEFYSATRQPFASPRYVAVLPTASSAPSPDGEVLAIDRQIAVAPGVFLIEFSAEPGSTYVIQYGNDMLTWKNATPAITAPSNRVQWFDSGSPKTDSPPAAGQNRFYRVIRTKP